MFVLCAERLKSTFLEKKILQTIDPFEADPFENTFKNVDF